MDEEKALGGRTHSNDTLAPQQPAATTQRLVSERTAVACTADPRLETRNISEMTFSNLLHIIFDGDGKCHRFQIAFLQQHTHELCALCAGHSGVVWEPPGGCHAQGPSEVPRPGPHMGTEGPGGAHCTLLVPVLAV